MRRWSLAIGGKYVSATWHDISTRLNSPGCAIGWNEKMRARPATENSCGMGRVGLKIIALSINRSPDFETFEFQVFPDLLLPNPELSRLE